MIEMKWNTAFLRLVNEIERRLDVLEPDDGIRFLNRLNEWIADELKDRIPKGEEA
jgi:hypothetical protein